MKQYVSVNKRSKKARKEYYSKMRRDWGGLNPATRTAPNGKAYDRNKDKQERRKTSRGPWDEGGGLGFYDHKIVWKERGELHPFPSYLLR